MAFSALRPCSRIMRASPHQSDQQEKELGYDLLLQEEQEKEEELDAEELETPHRKSFTCDDSPFKQPLSSDPSSLSSEPSSPVIEQLPTFIAPQGLHSLQLPATRRKECSKSWFAKHDHNGRHLVPLSEDFEAFTQSFVDTSINPVSNFHQRMPCSRRFLLQSKPKKPVVQHGHHSKQDLHSYKKCGGSNDTIIYGLPYSQTVSAHDMGGERKRHSSASASDMISSKDIAMWKNRLCNVQQNSSWEEEVRQALAKSSFSRRQSKEACKGGAVAGCGLPRSISVVEQGSSALPATLIVKQKNGHGQYGRVDVPVPIQVEEVGAKLIHDPITGGRTDLNKGAAEEKRMWKGFSVVKSPSEERWEEAAKDEERQEMQRRARSQSMRYDANARTSDLAGIGRFDGHVQNNDEEWAVYTRSGYVGVRPRKSDADVSAKCCSSLMGRSLSMRDTRMGLVMECAACGTALHGAGGHLLCFCSCCAAARSTTMQGTPSSQKKKGGSGILRACRRLLGLSKKQSKNQQF